MEDNGKLKNNLDRARGILEHERELLERLTLKDIQDYPDLGIHERVESIKALKEDLKEKEILLDKLFEQVN